jgi:hypothetical protein
MTDSPLSSLREHFHLSLSEVSRAYGTDPKGISRIEQRFKQGAIKLDTVRDFIEAMGGELKIVAQFPDEEIDITPAVDREP